MRGPRAPRRRRLATALSALLLCVPVPVVMIASPAHADDGEITGSVYIDDDPAVGVTVDLLQGGATPVQTDHTDEDGGYSITTAAGTNRLRFSLTGYRTAYLLTDDGAVADIVVAEDGSVTIGGEDYTDGLDDVSLAVAPAEVTGRVVNTGGQPLAGVIVRAYGASGTRPVGDPATSDASGDFTVTLPLGSYRIKYFGAVIDGVTYLDTMYGGGFPAQAVKIGPPTDGGVLALNPVTMPTYAPETGIPLRGITRDGAGAPLADVTVNVHIPGSNTPTATATSGPTGVFSVNVPPGDYSLSFAKQGYVPNDFESTDGSRAVVTVGATGTVTAGDLELSPDGAIVMRLLLPAPKPTKAPRLLGKPRVGNTLSATTGTWQGIGNLLTKYVTIHWYLDGKLADRFAHGSWSQRFSVPRSAAGKKLRFTLYLDDPLYVHAPATYTGKAVTIRQRTR